MNKIEMIKAVRTWATNTFGIDPELKISRDFVYALLEKQNEEKFHNLEVEVLKLKAFDFTNAEIISHLAKKYPV